MPSRMVSAIVSTSPPQSQSASVSFADESLRISFFDQADSLFDEMVQLHARYPGGEETALDYAERERARSLLDRLGGHCLPEP